MSRSDQGNLHNEITFHDLFDLEDLQRLQDQFSKATGVASIITRPDGTPITKPSNFCRLCRDIIRNTEKGLANCYYSDSVIGRPDPDGPIIQKCASGGLWDAGAGISVEGKHLANWLIGQVRDEAESEEHICSYAREIGVDEEEYRQALLEVPMMSLDRFNDIASMLFTLANQLSSVTYQYFKQTQLISALKATEADLRNKERSLTESEYRLKVVVDNLPSAMIYQVEFDLEGGRRFVYVSESVVKLNEVTAQSVLADGTLLYRQIHPDDLPRLMEAEEKAIAGMHLFRCEVRFILPSGTIRWFQLTSSPRRLKNGCICWDGIQIDITARKNAEKEHEKIESLLRQSQKIEAIGQLAGGVAHDLNNMLSPIIGYAELLSLDASQSTSNRKSLQGIIDAGYKARDLVQQLLAFSRKQTLDFQVVNLNSVVNDLGNILRRTIREDIEITFVCAPELPHVHADRNQLEQVIMNLVVNAQDAIQAGGTITVTTDMVVLSGYEPADKEIIAAGDYAILRVRDTGCGIDSSLKDQIFEPFFSTKGSKGTGLGLSTVYGIIKQHNGTISVWSEPDKGTTITIYLPVVEGHAEQSDKNDIVAVDHFGSETILLVEDEPEVCIMLEKVLRQKGYTILAVNNGFAALKLLKEGALAIDLLLTDVVMPGMNGRELYAEAVKIVRNLKVIYMSGHHDDVISHRGVLEKGTHFIQKPFSLQLLGQKIHEVLSEYR